MSELHNKKCIACDGSIPAFDVEEIHKYLKKVDGWDVLQNQEKNYRKLCWERALHANN